MCSRQKRNIEEKRKTTQTPQNWLLAPVGLHLHRRAPVSPLTSESHPTLVCSKQPYMHMSQLPWWRWPWGHQHCRGQWPGTGSVAAGAAPSFPGSCTSLSDLKKLDFWQRLSMPTTRMWGILKDLLKPAMTHVKIKHFWIWKDHLSPLRTKPFFYPSPHCKLFGKGDLLSLSIQGFMTMWYLIFSQKNTMKKHLSPFFSLHQFRL